MPLPAPITFPATVTGDSTDFTVNMSGLTWIGRYYYRSAMFGVAYTLLNVDGMTGRIEQLGPVPAIVIDLPGQDGWYLAVTAQASGDIDGWIVTREHADNPNGREVLYDSTPGGPHHHPYPGSDGPLRVANVEWWKATGTTRRLKGWANPADAMPKPRTFTTPAA
jgi:hypothetical protein